ncbi:hypothetical protein LZ30DRAFT_118734 [Colletotrichum cereale]|nr:hypothetical protein LZ30DRAFT_118734 [Colletotrichum cereale]
MSPNIFRIFNPGGEKENPVDKRRTQLRNAQRSYRDRKDRYTKSLEQEIAHTRANEAKLMARCDQLCATVEALTELLAQNGVTIPPGIEGNAEDKLTVKYQGATDVMIKDLSHQSSTTPMYLRNSEHVRGKGMASSTKTPATVGSIPSTRDVTSMDEQTTQVPHLFSEERPLPGGPWSKTDQRLVESTSSCSRMCELDPMLVGMEFVLKVESPCLEHLGGNPKNPSEPTGHALTTSAQLIFSSSYGKKQDLVALPSYQDKPSYLLQRLLDLSPDLCSNGDLTPAQAWNYIRSQPQFGGIEVKRLWELAEKLRAEVKCHGFGAVIDSQSFEALVFQALMFAQDF